MCRYLMCLVLLASQIIETEAQLTWGGYTAARLESSRHVISDSNEFTTFRDALLLTSAEIALTANISQDFLSSIDVFYTSVLKSNGETSAYELQNILNWIYFEHGILIISAEFAGWKEAFEPWLALFNMSYLHSMEDVGTPLYPESEVIANISANSSGHLLVQNVSEITFNFGTSFNVPEDEDSVVVLFRHSGSAVITVQENVGGMIPDEITQQNREIDFGGILVLGDQSMLKNDKIGEADNHQFVKNIISWVAHLAPQIPQTTVPQNTNVSTFTDSPTPVLTLSPTPKITPTPEHAVQPTSGPRPTRRPTHNITLPGTEYPPQSIHVPTPQTSEPHTQTTRFPTTSPTPSTTLVPTTVQVPTDVQPTISPTDALPSVLTHCGAHGDVITIELAPNSEVYSDLDGSDTRDNQLCDSLFIAQPNKTLPNAQTVDGPSKQLSANSSCEVNTTEKVVTISVTEFSDKETSCFISEESFEQKPQFVVVRLASPIVDVTMDVVEQTFEFFLPYRAISKYVAWIGNTIWLLETDEYQLVVAFLGDGELEVLEGLKSDYEHSVDLMSFEENSDTDSVSSDEISYRFPSSWWSPFVGDNATMFLELQNTEICESQLSRKQMVFECQLGSIRATRVEDKAVENEIEMLCDDEFIAAIESSVQTPSITRAVPSGDDEISHFECSWFNETDRTWSNEGCETVDLHDVDEHGMIRARCRCTHTTAFAIMKYVKESKLSDTDGCYRVTVIGHWTWLLSAILFIIVLILTSFQLIQIWRTQGIKLKLSVRSLILVLLMTICQITVSFLLFFSVSDVVGLAIIWAISHILTFCIYFTIIYGWEVVYNDSLFDAGKKRKPLLKYTSLSLLLIVVGLFVAFFLVATFYNADLFILAGSILTTGLYFAIGVVFPIFGHRLVKMLNEVKNISSNSDSMNEVIKKLTTVYILVSVSMLIKSIFPLISAIKFDLYIENFIAFQFIYLLLDIFPLLLVLYLFHLPFKPCTCCISKNNSTLHVQETNRGGPINRDYRSQSGTKVALVPRMITPSKTEYRAITPHSSVSPGSMGSPGRSVSPGRTAVSLGSTAVSPGSTAMSSGSTGTSMKSGIFGSGTGAITAMVSAGRSAGGLLNEETNSSQDDATPFAIVSGSSAKGFRFEQKLPDEPNQVERPRHIGLPPPPNYIPKPPRPPPEAFPPSTNGVSPHRSPAEALLSQSSRGEDIPPCPTKEPPPLPGNSDLPPCPTKQPPPLPVQRSQYSPTIALPPLSKKDKCLSANDQRREQMSSHVSEQVPEQMSIGLPRINSIEDESVDRHTANGSPVRVLISEQVSNIDAAV